MDLSNIAPLAITFVIAGVVLSIGAEILGDLETGVSGTTASNAVNNSTEGIRELASWLPTLGLVIAAAVVIGAIFSAFGAVGRRDKEGAVGR